MTREELLSPTPEEVSMYGFEDNANVKPITLRELEQSIRVEGKNGRLLQTRPTQSWSAISYIIGLLEQNSMNYDLESIYVQRRNSFPMLNDSEKNLGYNRDICPINRWMFDKVLACIKVPNIGNDLSCARIGFGFNENGIQVAFGMHVHVCQNFNILGGQVMRTYKHNYTEAISWETIEYRLKEWAGSLDQKFKVELELMNRMQNRAITDDRVVQHVIGGLYQRAIDQAYFSHKPAPFDTAGMSNFVQQTIKSPNGRIENVWDLYNYGTSILKPGTVDIADIQESSSMFADYLFDEFEILKN